ncbi:MAG: lysophospholipid acyltransferase family protein [Helicobacteraceae bacterium]|jgi:KDO2-lipid IV(A) lauroyltransferase|nr:lysophospholipid acyltransferase family protein [Helicobacteraceae bacterium]
MTKSKRRKYRYGVFGAKRLLRFLAALSLKNARRFGAFIAVIGWYFPTTHKRVTLKNLEICFPSLSAAERKKLARESLIESAKTAAEMGALCMWEHKRCLELVEKTENESLLDEAIAAKKGVILLAPHVGNWEMMRHFLASKSTFIALYEPPKIKDLEPLLVAIRDKVGMISAPANAKGVTRLFRELSKGAVTAILPDTQPAKRAGGVFAPFFGVEALTPTFLQKAAQKTGAIVVCGVALRSQNGFMLIFSEVDQNIYNPDEKIAATALNRSIEICVNLDLKQYIWEYKRFRSRPAGEKAIYAV